MELQYFGANCLSITTKKSQTVVDPSSDIASLKTSFKKVDLVLATQPAFLPDPVLPDSFVIDSPGEYEFADCSVKGVAAQPHTAASGDLSATMYRFSTLEASILVTGHVSAQLSELQLEEIGLIDIVVVPVGGGGYTLDAQAAASLVRAVEPKLVIPVQYATKTIKYTIPQQELDIFTKELSAQLPEPVEKFKLKTLPDQLTIQVLQVSA